MAEQSKLKRPAAAAITLNNFPDSILIQILSLLPSMTAIIEASFISRRWRNLWHFIPNLEFYLDPPYSDDPVFHLGLVNSITQVLLNRPKSIPFTAFSIAIRYFPNHRHRSLISSWLLYAFDCGVEDVSLIFDGKGNDDPKNLFDFHFSDLGNRHVKCLFLYRCEIVMPGNISSRFDSLRVLELVSVDVVDELLTNLVSKCENLEELRLELFDGVRNFRICSKSLKVLKLLRFIAGANTEHSSAELCTPNLSKITVHDFYVATFTGDLTSVNEAEVIFSNIFKNSEKCWGNAMNLLRGVENLKMKGFVPSKFEADECFQLRSLRHLELMVGSLLDDLLGVSRLLEQCPALETLVFGIFHKKEYDDEDGVGELNDAAPFLDEISKPNAAKFHSLREVKVQGFRNRLPELLILHLLDERRVVLNKVVLVPDNLGEAPVVLSPTSDDLNNFWLKYVRVILVEASRLIRRKSAELEEARRALSFTKEDSEEDMGGGEN